MQDTLAKLEQLNRPRLLIRAAKAGATEYARDQDLRRHISHHSLPQYSEALSYLYELENTVDQQRRNGSAAYSIVKHVDLLIAMLGEAQLLRATQSL
ncbi:DUF6477 family protein [Shimia sagamensis]|uniref:Uncharacterized protein n=1 Tax=Shimia sagamensis TaxID=1566352 RepID=A0ABY1NL58_9RHOB|nr:DUF6477 family protein [Shimia sagamensis]SMP12584.1 hypothetical protein SAMN06265373_102364 [Shimia sagamensis]